MKKILLLIITLCVNLWVYACPVCERNQPKLLKGIVHGSGPENNWDYVSMWGMVVIVVLTLFFSIKWLIQPNEKNTDHIKNSILTIE